MEKLFSILGVLCCLFAVACAPDYGIIYPDPIYVEVPVYIEQEIPEDPGLVWVDSLTQIAGTDGTDILWIIDTSCSMADDASNLLAGIDAMINSLPPTGWRLNMLSADPKGYDDEQFPLVPGDTIVEAEAMYNKMYRGPYEKGFEALQKYMEDSLYAKTWMRPGAALLVVFVSDEDDQSTDVFYNVSDFIDWLNYGRNGIFMSSIVNLEPAQSLCNTSVLEEGARYSEVTAYYGGVIVDICSEDWSPGVRDAAAQLEPHESIALTHEPIEDSIRVFADGLLHYDWYYDRTTNTIYFIAIPPVNTLIEVGYRYNPADTGIDTGK